MQNGGHLPADTRKKRLLKDTPFLVKFADGHYV